MEIIRVKLSEIRTNKNNIYEQCNIEELADSIKQYGQLENGTVYKEESNSDSKKYTLVGGHRRFLALNYLAERGDIEPFMNISIIEKPNTEQEEDLLLVADNTYRKKDTWTELKEVEIALAEYNRLCELGQRPQGKKRDWIGKKTGMGGRKVQELLNSLVARPNPNTITLTSSVTSSVRTTRTTSNSSPDYSRRVKRVVKTCKKMAKDISENETEQTLLRRSTIIHQLYDAIEILETIENMIINPSDYE